MRLADLRSQDLRQIERVACELAELDDQDAIEIAFIEKAPGLLGGDCVTWNNWTLRMDSVMTSRANASYAEENRRLGGALNAFLHHHPILRGGAFLKTLECPQLMSDFESSAAFRENPLYREVFRHLDARFQLASTPCVREGGTVSLTWNRRIRDFGERDRAILHVVGQRLAVVLHRLDSRKRLERACGALSSWVAAGAETAREAKLTAEEGRLLAGLLARRPREEIAARLGWRRDTLDRRLARIRNRLGVENTAQLLSGLTRLAPGGKR